MNRPPFPLRAVSALPLLFLCSLTVTGRSETRDLIVVAGQSNAVGFDAYAEDLPPDASDSKTLFWWRVGDPPPDEFDGTSARQWTHLQFQPRTEAMAGDAAKKTGRQYGNFNRKSKGGFGPEIGLARTLASREAKPLAILKTAFSGTSVAGDWNIERTNETQNCYRAMLEESKLAIETAKKTGLDLRFRALVWVQGESDANSKDAPLYAANLANMLEKLRADLTAPDMILLVGVNTRFGNGNNQFMPSVIESQKSVASRLSRARYVDTDGAETLPPSHTHFTAQGTLEIGRRYAQALLEVESSQPKAR